MSVWLGLFFASLLAATVLPFYSEVYVGAMLVRGYDPLTLWIVATAGNTLGSVVNWALARYLLGFQDRRWFPFPPQKLERAQRGFQRFGVWSLLFAWAPVVGDALTFIAGLMRVRLVPFVLLVGLGKGVRYAVVLLIVGGFL